ncbi:MAG: BolA/IbaG family iron-sulfur metabolism protein [Myxococcota bacterium]|nr:BolA/IbaG family iron-sulfur metabolism protein [Myxococcota bacterium]
MAIQIHSEPPPEPEEVAARVRDAIAEAMPEAEVRVDAVSPGHFEIEVVSDAFQGLSRVKQQQKVYAAIAHLMAGDTAPVHAVDRMVTRTAS